MLQLLNAQGDDLVALPPPTARITVPSLTTAANVRIDCLLVQADAVPYNRLTGTLDWNDGSRPIVYTGTTYNGTGTIALDVRRSLHAGTYIVHFEASNYEVPVSESLSANFPVQVVVASGAVSVPIVYGPILPKDQGYPNSEQWNFNRGSDLEIIVSSLKMLLMTNKGERIMLPEYGTNLRLLLFEFQSPGIVSMCQQEIIDATTKWEPRAALNFLTVDKTGDREVTVNALFTSKLNQQQFPLSLPFTV